jgi:adenylate cyclase, class 2
VIFVNEIELKFKLNSLKEKNELEKKLISFKAKKIGFFFESNSLFDFENRSISENDCVLRLRKINNDCFLCFKGPLKSKKFKERMELEFKVNEKNTLKDLQSMGLKKFFIYEKKKTVFNLMNSVIDVAELPVIGFWIEIEGSKKEIKLIAEKIGFNLNKGIVKSFPQLFKEEVKKKKLKKKFMVF